MVGGHALLHALKGTRNSGREPMNRARTCHLALDEHRPGSELSFEREVKLRGELFGRHSVFEKLVSEKTVGISPRGSRSKPVWGTRTPLSPMGVDLEQQLTLWKVSLAGNGQ